MNQHNISLLTLKLVFIFVMGLGILNGQDIWQPTGGPLGGYIVAVDIDPATGDYYILSNGFIYRSTDQAQSWLPIPKPEVSVANAAMCINSAGDIFIGASNMIYRTSDRGKSWQLLENGPKAIITALYYDYKSGNVLAGTYRAGIFRSGDNGDTWSAANSGLTNFENLTEWCLFVHTDGKLYAGGGASGQEGGIFFSIDKGSNWTRINGDITNTNISNIAVNSAGQIFVTTFGGGGFRSDNDGKNWIRLGTDLPSFQEKIVILPSNYVFIGSSQDGIFISKDNGDTWNMISLTPGDVDVLDMVYDNRTDKIITGCQGSGILVGSQGGSSWRFYNDGLHHGSIFSLSMTDHLYAAGWGMGLSRLQLDNMNWKSITYDLPSFKTASVTVKPGYVFAATQFDGLHRLPETGSSWTDITNGLAHPQVIFVYAASDGVLFAQTGTVYHFYRSTDNGATWTEIFGGDYNSSVRCMIGKTSSGYYFAGTVGNGILRSTDGLNWTAVNEGLSNLGINSLEISIDHKRLFAGTDDGLYTSDYTGVSWTKMNTPLSGSVKTVVINYTGTLFIGYTNNGVYLSEDNGDTWQEYNNGLQLRRVHALKFDSDNYLYAAISGGSVYRTIRSTTARSIQFSVRMKYQIGFDPSNDTVLVRGNFNRWGDDPLILEPLGDADLTYVGSWITNRPDTVLSGSMEGTVYFNFSYLDTDMADEVIETADAKDYQWNVNSDAETPTVWFDDQQLFSRLIYGPVYSDLGDSRGVAWGDYDGDGYQDVVITNSGTQNYLYRNERNGQFTRYSGEPLASDVRDSSTPAWGDYDNDGDLDLFIANKGTTIGQNNFLYINNGDQTFSKMIIQSIVTDAELSNGAAWADYDKNGFVDLLVANLGQLNALYKNLGDSNFDRIGVSPFTVDQGMSAGCSWADFDNDGDPDLFIANAGSAPGEFNFLYENLGDGNFQKISSGNPIVTDKNLSNGGCWGDYNNDGWLDLYVVNRDGQPNVLYINQGGGNFVKSPDVLPTSEPGDSRCASWIDFDNDGWLDLLVTNMGTSDEGENNVLYRNLSDGKFQKISFGPIYSDLGRSAGHAWADYDRDGDLDLVVVNAGDQPNYLYRNNVEGKNWVKVWLEGTVSNQRGIGARIIVQTDSVRQMREIGSENSTLGQNEAIAHFGLSDFKSIDSLIVIWPNTGRKIYQATSVNTIIKLVEDIPDLPAATLLTPGDLAADVDTYPHFIWHKVNEALTYHFQLSEFADFREFVVDQSDLADTTFQYSKAGMPLKTATQYYWRVKAVMDVQGHGNWSTVWKFRTMRETVPVQALDVVSPAKGAAGVTLPVTFSWTDTSGYSGEKVYDLQVSTSPSFTDTVFEAYDLIAASATGEGLNYNTTYYWRARMTTPSGIYLWSDPPWSFSTEAGTKPAAPTLVNPSNGATDMPDKVLLTWSEIAGGTYHVRVATDNAFTDVVLDENLSVNHIYVYGLSNNTSYYWSVAVNVGGIESDPSAIWSFTTRTNEIQVSQSISFPIKERRDQLTAVDYRLFGLPGNVNEALDAVFGPDFGVKWMAYWDNGEPSNYYEPFDQAGRFKFLPGRGYWLISNGPIEVSELSLQHVALDNLAQTEIDIHEGFNIITNPFDIDVDWGMVRIVNSLPGTEPLYTYNRGFSQILTMKPYEGYYFDNKNSSRNKLAIPYFNYLPKINAGQQIDWLIKIELTDAVSRDATTCMGVAKNAENGLDQMDYRSPRAPGEILRACFYRPDWKDGFRYIAGDFRPPFEAVAYWDMQIHTPHTGEVLLAVSGISAVPEDYAVYLIDKTHGRQINLRVQDAYQFNGDVKQSEFVIAVGAESEIMKTIREIIPAEYALGQNFPNPFNPETTIPVTVPKRSEIALTVYDILGKQVKLIYKGMKEPGRHFIRWDGNDAAGNPVTSGIYFYQLQVDNGRIFSGKMVLIK